MEAFREIPVDFATEWNERKATHPFSGAAVIDTHGDGRFAIFVSGGRGQPDALLRMRDGRLVNEIEGTGLSDQEASYGATAIDINGDRQTDLLLAHNTGVFIYLNDRGRFRRQPLPVPAPAEAVPFSISAGDIDRDGDLDLYISYFVDPANFKSLAYNDRDHAKPNRLLLNQGGLNFKDITRSSGTEGLNNTFFSTFVDLDNDDYLDLVLVQNTGEVEIFENRKNRTFTRRGFASGYGVWMGLAVGDVDRDGDQDLMFTNAGTSVPEFLLKGDLREDQRQETDYLLLRNDGGFRFTPRTEAYGLTDLGFAWGAGFEDLNLDGELDLLVAQNYIKYPPHKLARLGGKAMLLLPGPDGSRAFYQNRRLGLKNALYGQSPLIADLNQDGRPDVVWLNMHGPVRAFLNRSPNDFISVALPDDARYHGAKVSVTTTAGRSYTRELSSGVGLLVDPAPILFFGLGQNGKVRSVTIRTLYGKTLRATNAGRNRVLTLADFR